MYINQAALYYALARNQMTLKELAKKAGVNPVTLTRLSKNMQRPQPITIGKLSEALGIDPSELISPEE